MKQALIIFLALAVLPAGAQDAGFGFDSGGEDEGGFGFDSGDGGFGFDGGIEDPLSIGVDLELVSRYYLLEETEDYSLDNLPVADLNISYSGDSSEAVFNLKFSESIIQNDPGRVIDEVYFRWFVDDWDFQIGVFKTTWGKGDGVHVLDVLNPKDYSDLNNVEPLDAKIAEAKIKANVGLGDTGRLELVYQPFFTPDTVPLEGRWTPGEFAQLFEQFGQVVMTGTNPTTNQVGLGPTPLGDGLVYQVYLEYFTAALLSEGSAADAETFLDNPATYAAIQTEALARVEQTILDSVVLPDTAKLEYSSGGLRYTDTFGVVDLGLQYFTGFWRRPVVDQNVTANDGQLLVSFNRFHQAGLDFGMVLGPLNIRGEVAGNFTEDLEGDDPLVYNSRLDYLAGFDTDLFGGPNLNLQMLAYYIFNHDQITSSLDVELGTEQDEYTLIGRLSDSFLQDKLTLEVATAWNIRGLDGLVNPQVSYQLTDEANIALSAKFFYGEEDGLLGYYNDQSFGQLKFTYSF